MCAEEPTVLTLLCALPLHPSRLPPSWQQPTHLVSLFPELTNYAGVLAVTSPGSQQPLPPQHWDYKHYCVFSFSPSVSSEAVTQITMLAQKHSMTEISHQLASSFDYYE